MTNFLNWFVAKNFLSVRSAMLYVAVWMTYDMTKWSQHFADSSKMDGTNIGLVLAAVGLPSAALTAYIYKQYSDSRPVETVNSHLT